MTQTTTTKPETKPGKPEAPTAPAAPATKREKPDNPYTHAYADFLEQTTDHALRVILDDGLNRQFRVGAPNSGIWSWRVATWPGYLATFGDIADGFMFTRIEDMLDFFDREGHGGYYSDGAPSIDFRYWAEKISGGRSHDVLKYSSDVFIRSVSESLDEHEDLGTEAQAEYQKIVDVAKKVTARHGVDYDEYLDELRKGADYNRYGGLEVDENDDAEIEFFGMSIPEKSPAELRDEIVEEAHDNADSSHEAREWLQEKQDIFGQDYYWESSLRDYDVHFLFACWAIELSVRLWREYEKTPEAQMHRNPGDSYVLVEGGLVQNDPALPVFDLDVLDSDAPNEDSAAEALALYRRIAEHPQASLELTDTLTHTADFVRVYGGAEDIKQLEALEAASLVSA